MLYHMLAVKTAQPVRTELVVNDVGVRSEQVVVLALTSTEVAVTHRGLHPLAGGLVAMRVVAHVALRLR